MIVSTREKSNKVSSDKSKVSAPLYGDNSKDQHEEKRLDNYDTGIVVPLRVNKTQRNYSPLRRRRRRQRQQPKPAEAKSI